MLSRCIPVGGYDSDTECKCIHCIVTNDVTLNDIVVGT